MSVHYYCKKVSIHTTSNIVTRLAACVGLVGLGSRLGLGVRVSKVRVRVS